MLGLNCAIVSWPPTQLLLGNVVTRSVVGVEASLQLTHCCSRRVLVFAMRRNVDERGHESSVDIGHDLYVLVSGNRKGPRRTVKPLGAFLHSRIVLVAPAPPSCRQVLGMEDEVAHTSHEICAIPWDIGQYGHGELLDVPLHG